MNQCHLFFNKYSVGQMTGWAGKRALSERSELSALNRSSSHLTNTMTADYCPNMLEKFHIQYSSVEGAVPPEGNNAGYIVFNVTKSAFN